MADRVRRENANRLDVVHADCAGIDIGKRGHYVAVDPERFEQPVRSFGTVTDELERMAAHLKSCGVRVVAMEATGVYWIPRCVALGADGGFVRHDGSFADAVSTWTSGEGVVGSYLAANLKSLNADGRLVIIGLLGGSRAELPQV